VNVPWWVWFGALVVSVCLVLWLVRPEGREPAWASAVACFAAAASVIMMVHELDRAGSQAPEPAPRFIAPVKAEPGWRLECADGATLTFVYTNGQGLTTRSPLVNIPCPI
jgi:hypothetical protein